MMESLIELLKINGDTTKVLHELQSIKSYIDREYIAITTGSRVVYFNDEVTKCQKDEESILKDVIPIGFTLDNLKEFNIINIGAGGRKVNDNLICLDFNRGSEYNSHNGIIQTGILSTCCDLPFKNNSIDGIISLHLFEHVADPVTVLVEWLRVLKPGARIGIIVPNFKYNWSASTDNYKYGHRWNTEPEIFLKLLNTHFNGIINIIKINTLEMKLSFNVVIEKIGIFNKFTIIHEKTGYEIDNGVNKNIGYYYHNNNLYV